MTTIPWFFYMFKIVTAKGRKLRKLGGDLEAQKQNIASSKRVSATRGYATPATRGTSLGPSQWLPWPVFSKNRKQAAFRVLKI
jgi:hypothetical protein